MLNLDQLPLNHTGNVKSIKCTGILERRLLDLGLVKDTPITAIFRSPLGDPTAYEFRGSIIAIRNDEAKNIYVELKNDNKNILEN